MNAQKMMGKVKKYLEGGSKNTIEILYMINEKTRDGTTSHQLGKLLSMDREVVKVGDIKCERSVSGSYKVCEWALREVGELK